MIIYMTYLLVDESILNDNSEIVDEETPTKVRIY